MSGLQKFEIQLDNPDHTFSPGEIIAGKVIVNLNRPKSIRGLKVKIKGSAHVQWGDTTGTGNDRKRVQFTGDEEYFRMEFYVLGQSGGENVEIQSGSHIFPFNFSLPRNIPSSFETSHGHIRYTIKAILDRPWKFDHETTIAFNVESSHELHSNVMTPLEDEELETFCCFSCFNVGSMKVNIFLPSRGFAIGEAIQAKITIDNSSASVDVEKVTLKLEQKIKLFARFPHSSTKKITDIVQEGKRDGPFSKKDEIIVSMQVPPLAYSSMPYCSLIDIVYYVKVGIVVSGCHCDTDKEYPVVIGSRSVINVQPTLNPMVSAHMPTAPYFPTESPMPMGTTTNMSTTMPMPSMPVAITAGPMPMPMPMPTMPMPYPPPQGEPGKTSGEYNAPAPGFVNPMPSYGYGNQPYPPAMPGPVGFVTPNPAQAMPPSYNEAMGINGKR